MATITDRKNFVLPKEVRSILAVCDEAVADSSSLADLVGKIIANGLNKLIKG